MKLERAEARNATLIAVAGCVAQAQGAEIIRRQPAVDLVIGPQSYHRLPEMIARAHRSAGERLATDFEADAKFDALPERAASGVTAFLTVQEGCDRFCTFCVVPYTRGAEYSRPVEDMLVEARALARRRRARGHPARPERQRLPRPRMASTLAALIATPRPPSRAWRGSAIRPAIRADMSDDLIAAHG